jgi:predicted nucleic acid-binding Zn ribbon protein
MKCLECGKDVPKSKGKRERKFCDDTCKLAYYRKNRKSDGLYYKKDIPKP